MPVFFSYAVWKNTGVSSKRAVTVKTVEHYIYTVKTVEKWFAEKDKELDTATCLKFVKGVDRQYVASLKRSVCIKYEERVYGCRHFNPASFKGLVIEGVLPLRIMLLLRCI